MVPGAFNDFAMSCVSRGILAIGKSEGLPPDRFLDVQSGNITVIALLPATLQTSIRQNRKSPKITCIRTLDPVSGIQHLN